MYFVFTIELASGMRLSENQVFTARTTEDEEETDLEREQLTFITHKKMPQARGDSLPTTHRESRNADSERFRTGSM